DPTGAGDAFDGGFVVGLLRGWDYRRIGRFANAVAGLKVTRFGPMEVPTLSEVEAFLRATG
ncbi:TPA: carbohydrate kinase family protein, partial [Candidatus Bathyarchaeota archaeon]|nr:carbohydrate kinase family protein [Candidatus Bathyarchaeota archaeon]